MFWMERYQSIQQGHRLFGFTKSTCAYRLQIKRFAFICRLVAEQFDREVIVFCLNRIFYARMFFVFQSFPQIKKKLPVKGAFC